jgi:tRNA(Ile)-lysidine synthase
MKLGDIMLEYLIDDKFVESSDGVAVGVSGGADSMVLLWALLDKQKEVGFDLHVVNVNHHIRGESSDNDSKFVEDFCKSKKIKYTIVDVDAKKLKAEGKLTLEEAARLARYDAFEKVMKKEHLNKLFLAHHKNDQVETILMHLFRGAGISGACGIVDSNKTFRPLLKFSKAELLKLAADHGIKFVTDETNGDNAYARNYVRNIVIPDIEKMYPGVVGAIFEFGEKCKNVEKFIKNQVKIENIQVNKEFVLLKDAIFETDLLVIREYIKQAFAELEVFADIESKHYDAIVALKDAKVNTCIDAPHGVVVGRTYQGIKFFKKEAQEINTQEFDFVIGETVIDGVGKIVVDFVSADDVVYGEGVLYVDYNKVSTDAVWRTRRIGDVFSKFGTGSKKLNDYFTDKKIENLLRDKIPVLASGNQVLVVAGEDISENAKIDGETEQIVAIRFVNN